jgi:hypothetical protein
MAKSSTLVSEAPLRHADAMTASWQQSNATYLAGRAELDGLDFLAANMEAKWGIGRLRLLVSTELREKFDRQRLKLAMAIRQGGLEDVKREAPRMAAAWRALDRAATEAGAANIDPDVIEIALPSGMVCAIVRDLADARAVQATADGRRMVVHSHDEIGRLIAGLPGLIQAKVSFPGASVEAVRPMAPSDPLTAIEDFDDSIIPF